MATSHPHPNPVDDPEFYCHSQACIDGGCSPMFCKDESERAEHAPDEDEWDYPDGYSRSDLLFGGNW